MYTPPAFAEPRAEVLHAFIDAHPLAALVTAEGGLFATHLPLLLHREAGALGVLRGHVARANPHAALAAAGGAGADALVLFAGPDAYVTPAWYASKQEHGRVVPTWNYAAVHAGGRVRVVDDADFVLRHLAELTRRHEAARPRPWSVDDAPPGYVAQTARATVGVEIEITRLEGKWKMSQNRPAADIAGVVAGLAASDDAGDRAVAAEVAARRPRGKR